MNRQQLQQDILELQEHLEEKQKSLAAMPDKWEPKGGEYYVSWEGLVRFSDSTGDARIFGVEYATREQAEKALMATRAHNRLLNYVAEFAPDYQPDWSDENEEKAYLSKLHRNGGGWVVFVHAAYQSAGIVYMPASVADELCNKLNSGEVQL